MVNDLFCPNCGRLWTMCACVTKRRKESQQPMIKNDLRTLVLRRDNYTCKRCGKKFPPENLHVHHIIPKKIGGTDALENLETLCEDCHRFRHYYDTEYQNELDKYRQKLRELFKQALKQVLPKLDKIILSELKFQEELKSKGIDILDIVSYKLRYYDFIFQRKYKIEMLKAKGEGRRSVWFKKSGEGNLRLAERYIKNIIRKNVWETIQICGTTNRELIILFTCTELEIPVNEFVDPRK